ncbi:hypothetical protein PIB30_025501 [Stylosanthes scabra]|uniref:FRIGIDA-like protein n=1 Tax=Stylosanthes scabra TaxID=79078 RepID=A0ABU6X7M7_9FABA|nr:hypothetical protein [Stylosanthes scabra]
MGDEEDEVGGEDAEQLQLMLLNPSMRTCTNNTYDSKKRQLEQAKFDHLRPSVKKSKLSDSDASMNNQLDSGKSNVEDDDGCDVTHVSQGMDDPAKLTEESTNAEDGLEEKEPALVLYSIEECQMKRQIEEKRLHSLKRYIEELSDELQNKKKQVNSMQGQLNSYSFQLEAKKGEYVAILSRIKRCNGDFRRKEKQLKFMQKLIIDCKRHLRLKEKQCIREVEMTLKVISERNKVHKKRQREIEEGDDSIFITEAQFSLMENLTENCGKDLTTEQVASNQIKKRAYGAIKRCIEICNKEFEAKREQLKSIQKLISECERHLRLKEKQYTTEVEKAQEVISKRDKVHKKMQKEIEEYDDQIFEKEAQISLIEDVISNRDKVHKKMQKEIEEYDDQIFEKEAHISLIEDMIKECKNELMTEQTEFHQAMDNMIKDRERKEEELKALLDKISEQSKELMTKEEELGAIQKLIVGQAKALHFEKLHEIMTSKTNQDALVKEIELMKKQYERSIKEVDSKGKLFVAQMEELKLKEKYIDGREKELVLKEKRYEEQVEKLNSKEKQIEGRVKELESREREFEDQVEELESNKKHVEGKLKELLSKEMQFEGQVMELNSKEKQSEGLKEELKSKEIKLEVQEKDLETKWKQFEEQMNELKLKQKEVENKARDLESKKNQFEGLREEFELKKSQYEALKRSSPTEKKDKSIQEEKLQDNQSSPAIDGRTLELFVDESTNPGDDILVHFRSSSDPAKLTLDIIKDPIVSHYKNGVKVVTIDDSHVFLLEQLMRISPHIKPHVREEAMELALDLKANMIASAENSLVVLGFLMFLSIYGLASSFDEDEVLRLLKITALHKQSVEMFRILGFADKSSEQPASAN